MRSHVLLPFLITFIFLAKSIADEQTAINQRIATLAKAEIEAGRAVGLVIGVAKNDEILHLEGYGQADIELSVAADPRHVFRIGSVTKMFTAAAILLLAEEGKLDLDDPLTKYLPDYPEPGNKITIRHLLQHTSGILSLTNLPDHRDQMHLERKQKEVVARFSEKPNEFPPGARFKYNNSGYFLLGIIIEKASGQTYEDFLKERIFDPLELTSTFYDRHARIIPNRASGYTLWGKPTNAPYFSTSQPFAAGALVSTAGDLIKFSHGLASGKILKPESRKLMVTPGTTNNGKKIPYGFGCFVGQSAGNPVIRHGGGIPGFVSELSFFPQSGHTVVVLANANRVNVKALADKVARICLPKGAD